MRILTIATSYPRHEGDWAGRFVRDLNAGCAALGHSVTTLAPWAAGLAREERDGAAGRVRRVGAAAAAALFYGAGAEANARRIGPFRTLRGFREATAAFERAIGEELAASDLILAHWTFPCAWWAAKLGPAIPLAGIVHGADARFLMRPVAGRVVARRIRRALDAVACVSAGAWQRIRSRLGRPGLEPVITPMGIDTGVFAASPAEARETGLVAAAGRLVPSKGYDLLVEACAGLGVRLVIAGDGPERAALERLAGRRDVALDLPGTLPPPALADLFRRAAAVVVPSRGEGDLVAEGAPMVAMEALACGAAVIGTDAGGLREILGGSAIAAPTAPALRQAIAEALAFPDAVRDPGAATRFDRVTVAERLLTGIGA